MGSARSNWEAAVNVVALCTDGSSSGASLNARASGCIGLAETATMLGESVTETGWRRKIHRRLRHLERLHQVEILVPQSGRRGTVVRLEGLREACPIPVFLHVAVRDLRERVATLESQMTAIEGEIRGPESGTLAKAGRK